MAEEREPLGLGLRPESQLKSEFSAVLQSLFKRLRNQWANETGAKEE